MNEYIVNLMESNELELTFECEYSEYSNAFTYAIDTLIKNSGKYQ